LCAKKESKEEISRLVTHWTVVGLAFFIGVIALIFQVILWFSPHSLLYDSLYFIYSLTYHFAVDVALGTVILAASLLTIIYVRRAKYTVALKCLIVTLFSGAVIFAVSLIPIVPFPFPVAPAAALVGGMLEMILSLSAMAISIYGMRKTTSWATST
jgi:hypothetical protein